MTLRRKRIRLLVGILVIAVLTILVAASRASSREFKAGSSRFLASGVFKRVSADQQLSENKNPYRPDRELSSATAGRAMGDLAGTWRGINGTNGQLRIMPNGSYTLDCSTGGRVKREGNRLLFDGPLSAWDNGRATLNQGAIEFYWTGPDGDKNWFTFGRE